MALTDDVLAITSNVTDARWNVSAPLGTPVVVTFSFGDGRAAYDTQHPNAFAPWTEEHKTYLRQALAVWDLASGIHFVEVPDIVGGQIRMALYDMTGSLNSVGLQASGWGYYPSYARYTSGSTTWIEPSFNTIGGDVYFNSNYYAADASGMAPGQRGYSIALHEIGHALGFKHPFEGVPVIDPAHDNGSYTVMSYSRPHSTTELGSVDVEAARTYYGISDVAYSWNASTLSLAISGSAGNDVLLGTELADVIGAGDGNDLIHGTPGNDSIDGGRGVDTASYARWRSSYTVTSENGTLTVTSGANGTDSLVDVERLAFLDGSLAFDIGAYEHAGMAYRLYQAAFNRPPDSPGLGYWIRELDAGKGDLAWVANNFIISNEFQETYGSPVSVTDTQFIELLYQNVLHRTPDAEGLSYWQSELDRGFERSRVLASFSESIENQQNVIGVVQDGIFYT